MQQTTNGTIDEEAVLGHTTKVSVCFIAFVLLNVLAFDVPHQNVPHAEVVLH